MVLEGGWSINRASRRLGVNPSTGKLIVKKFKLKGTFTVKKMRDYYRNEEPVPSAPVEQQNNSREDDIEIIRNTEDVCASVPHYIFDPSWSTEISAPTFFFSYPWGNWNFWY
jgi:hypothetical protein